MKKITNFLIKLMGGYTVDEYKKLKNVSKGFDNNFLKEHGIDIPHCGETMAMSRAITRFVYDEEDIAPAVKINLANEIGVNFFKSNHYKNICRAALSCKRDI